MSDTAIDETQRKGSVVTSSTAFSNNRTAEGLRPRSHQQLARDQNAYEFNTTSSSLLVMTCPIKCKAFTQCMPKRFFTAEKWIEDMLISCLCLPLSISKCSLLTINIEDAIPSGFQKGTFLYLEPFSLPTRKYQMKKTTKESAVLYENVTFQHIIYTLRINSPIDGSRKRIGIMQKNQGEKNT
ncbi:hypothetical protein BD560DRAFT_493093 [Blakeslea trispora]|nr:hypothetical protein BD560DRAFT_493093 [Blakeslea trispora]